MYQNKGGFFVMSKKGARGGGSIRQRKDVRWEARYTVGRDPGTGKQNQKSVYGRTQAEVRKKLTAICRTIDKGIYTEPKKLTIESWGNIWVNEYTVDLKPLTLKSYRGHLKNHIIPNMGAIKLSELNTSIIQSFYNKLELSPKTIKNIHGVVHKMLQQALELGYIHFNPSDACKLPRVEKIEIEPLKMEDTKSFLQAIKGHFYESLFLVDLFTGMRQGEILGLTWDCINFDKGTIKIYRQLQKIDGEYMLVSVKNDRARTITPAPSVMSILKNQRKLLREWKLKAGASWNNSDNLVFVNPLGSHLCHITVYKNVKKVLKSINMPGSCFHDLRHTYATASLESGDNIKIVQQNLGHATASFTLDVYGHVSEQMKKDSANRMQGYITSIAK